MIRLFQLSTILCCAMWTAAPAQEKSVRPGINDSFRDANVSEYIEKFEIESREVFSKRAEIVAESPRKWMTGFSERGRPRPMSLTFARYVLHFFVPCQNG